MNSFLTHKNMLHACLSLDFYRTMNKFNFCLALGEREVFVLLWVRAVSSLKCRFSSRVSGPRGGAVTSFHSDFIYGFSAQTSSFEYLTESHFPPF